MFDVAKLTLEEIDAEYAKTLDKLERLSKLREAVAEQETRRIKRLVEDYNAAQRKEADGTRSVRDQGV